MKAALPLLFAGVAAFATVPAHAQIPVYPPANLVLGADDFVTVGSMASTPSGLSRPGGLAIDPTSEKLFVASSNQQRILRFPPAASLVNGNDAEAVFGWVDFSGRGSSGTSGANLSQPIGIHVDTSGRLWVADQGRHRVLMFRNASTLGSGATADLVLGQPDFTSGSSGVSMTSMRFPTGVFVDGGDNLWVADWFNNRVLKFAEVSSLANGAAASVVLGQQNFITSTWSAGVSTMYRPSALSVDGGGRLWVADSSNNRVLRFDHAAYLGNGANASAVLGQPNFYTATPDTTANKMRSPGGIFIDATGALYVSDSGNHRVLIFGNAVAKANGAAADGLIGQPDFTIGNSGTTERTLNAPQYGLARDETGRLWVSDLENHRVLRFPEGTTDSLLQASLTAVLASDANGNMQADAGDGLFYTLTLFNPDDEWNVSVPGVRFTLATPSDVSLEAGFVYTSQGTVTTGNSPGDGSIEIELGAIADAGTARITFSATVGYEAAGQILVQGTVTSDLPEDLLTDDPALPGAEDATEFAVNFTYRPATLSLARVIPVKGPAATLSGTATNAVSVEVTRKPSGPTRVFPVVGTSWQGRVTGLEKGPNRYTVKALGKDGAYTAPQVASVRRLAPPRRR